VADVATRSAPSSRRTALAQAILVTFLWSTSWVLIKIGLEAERLEPLTFAGLRYVLAALVLLPFVAAPLRRRAIGRRAIGRIALLGLLFYAATQGAQFVALGLLPAAAVSLALTATPVLLLLIASVVGTERPSVPQALGILALLIGAALYFGPIALGPAAALGLAVAGAGTFANALSALLGRSVALDAVSHGGILPLTALSMLLGGIVLLGTGLATSGAPAVSPGGWAIIAWLAVVNTAFAFSLWNHTLRTLTAVESSVLNNTMLVQIAILAWLFLGEALDARQIAGLVFAVAGVVVVQLAPRFQHGASPQDLEASLSKPSSETD
jgi:drug/metabolite transporter (DMT)-like permease